MGHVLMLVLADLFPLQLGWRGQRGWGCCARSKQGRAAQKLSMAGQDAAHCLLPGYFCGPCCCILPRHVVASGVQCTAVQQWSGA